MEKLFAVPWHHLPSDEIVTILESDTNKGIDLFETGHRQARFGVNRLTPQKGKNPFVMFLLQFHQPLVYILLGATLITFVLQEWIDSESPRVCRRLKPLRGLANKNSSYLFPLALGTSSAHGVNQRT